MTNQPSSPHVDREPDIDRDDLEQLRGRVAAANAALANAVASSADLGDPNLAAIQLRALHQDLIESYQEVTRALDRVENVMRTSEFVDSETPKGIVHDHGDRITEQYNDSVQGIALLLLEYNRRKWLHEKPATNGADAVRRHGLTKNQRKLVNDLQEGVATDGE